MITEPGLYADMNCEAYFADPCPTPSLNNSLIDTLLHQTPMHVAAKPPIRNGGSAMAARDYTSAPVSDQLGIPAIIAGLCSDLDQLRKGQISVNDAMARSMLAKQIFNGVRLYLNGSKLLSENAKPASAIESRRAETLGSVEDESATRQGDAQ